MCDFRGSRVAELCYPATAAVVVAGLPGAGKSTALRALFGSDPAAEQPPGGPAGSVLLDSQHARNAWRRRFAFVPYPLWRPVMHLVHYRRIRVALRENDGPVIIHDCLTIGPVRRLLTRWAARHDRELHLVLIDVSAELARTGQQVRGRRSNSMFFRLHCLGWARLLRAVEAGRLRRPASIVICDRPAVGGLARVGFTAR